MNRFPVGFKILMNSSAQSSGLKSTQSQPARSLFIGVRPGKGIFPVECFPMLYGGSVRMKSIELSGILFMTSLLSPHNKHFLQFGLGIWQIYVFNSIQSFIYQMSVLFIFINDYIIALIRLAHKVPKVFTYT